MVWVELARARLGQGHYAGTDTEALLHHLVARGVLLPVLSATNYLEIWHRARWRSRHAVAQVMRDVTGYRSVAPIDWITHREIQRAADTLEGRAATPVDPFGSGVRHAFDHPMGRLRLVARVTTPERQEGPPLPTPPEWVHIADEHPDVYEWWSLAGPDEDFPARTDGLDRAPEHRAGSEFARDQQQLRRRIAAHGLPTGRLDEAILVERFTADVLPALNDICKAERLDPRQLVGSVDGDHPMRQALSAFVRSLPTQDVLVTLLQHKHRNPAARWTQHDRTDVTALAAAVSYCDAVVLDAEWHHHATTARLGDRYRTELLRSATLPRYLRVLDQDCG